MVHAQVLGRGRLLQVESGIVNRTVRLVPITRITALTAYRSFTQRLVGVWGLKIQSPGDRHGSVISLGSLSGRRVDELVAALEGAALDGETDAARDAGFSPDVSETNSAATVLAGTLQSRAADKEPEVIAALNTRGMLIAAVTNNTIPLIAAAALVVWIRFSDFLPARTKDFVQETIVPLGSIATW